MNRREFVRLLSLSGAAAFIPACRKTKTPTPARPNNVPPPFADRVEEITSGAEPGLDVLVGAGELLVSSDQRIPFGLVGPGNKLVEGPPGKIWVGREGKVSGPFDLAYRPFAVPEEHAHGEGLAPAQGFYTAGVPFDRPGTWDLLVRTTGEGTNRFGFKAVSVLDGPQAPAPGGAAPLVKTPTVQDPAGVAAICTRKPPCPMHEVSLDAAAGKGHPVVLSIATPAFCQSRMCGPVVEEIIKVREEQGGGATFIHAEVYADTSAQKLAPIMQEWKLQSEPWTYIIGGDGKVAARFEGPVTAAEVSDALTNVA